MPDAGQNPLRLNDLRQRWESDRDSRIFLQLAEEYRKLEQYPEAIEVLKDGLERRPRDLSGMVALGRCYLETDEVEPAIELLDAVVARDPAHMLATKLLVEAHLQRSDAERASERLELYRLLNDRDPELDHLEYRLEKLLRDQRDAAEEETAPPVVPALPVEAAPPVVAPPAPAASRPRPAASGPIFDFVTSPPPQSSLDQLWQAPPPKVALRQREDPFDLVGLDTRAYKRFLADEGIFLRPSELPQPPPLEAPVVAAEPVDEKPEQLEVSADLEPVEDAFVDDVIPDFDAEAALSSGIPPLEQIDEPAEEAEEAGWELASLEEVGTGEEAGIEAEEADFAIAADLDAVDAVDDFEEVDDFDDVDDVTAEELAAAAELEPLEPELEPLEADLEPYTAQEAAEWEEDEAALKAQVEASSSYPELAADYPELAADVAGESEPEVATATLGRLYLQQGHLAEAERIFRQLLRKDPGNSAAQDGLRQIRQLSPPEITAARLLAAPGVALPEGLTAKKVLVLQGYLKRLRSGGEAHVH